MGTVNNLDQLYIKQVKPPWMKTTEPMKAGSREEVSARKEAKTNETKPRRSTITTRAHSSANVGRSR
ncbi:hypothetical protein EVAR_89620_1 [Eumeta japonica]|uniref:Uncharacterized protein n=1 Tax=Eumeta variegata TaxID=151549 RepID=A0A4C1XND9_EUMVA|nr:hypothetical protein EVAR_89620_1 [Eumeta japonica]